MTAVLDVSASIEILLRKEKQNLFGKVYEEASWIIAPDLYVPEITNVLWKYYKAGMIPYADCIQFAEDGIDMIDDFFDSRELWKEALGEGMKTGRSVYDLYYAVLARRNEAALLTRDQALVQLATAMKIEVIS